jgi:hypothetical protein
MEVEAYLNKNHRNNYVSIDFSDLGCENYDYGNYELIESEKINITIYKINGKFITYGVYNGSQFFPFKNLEEKEDYDRYIHIHHVKSEIFEVENELLLKINM